MNSLVTNSIKADKTVSAQLEVSELTTAFQTQVVPMPVCKYEILEGGPTGQPIQFATIGQQVYHKVISAFHQANVGHLLF